MSFMKIHRLFFLLISLMLLSSCSPSSVSSTLKSIFTFKTSPVWLKKVSFRVSDKVNDLSPVVLHIVIPYTEDLLKDLSKMSSEDYFDKIKQIKLDNEENIDIFEWDLVRSEHLNDELITPHKEGGEGILVFARYSTPGAHRTSIGEYESVTIVLEDNDFFIKPDKDKK